MIEPIMYLAIGFLVSMLFGLMIVPLVHNRAVRLTTRRLEAATPRSRPTRISCARNSRCRRGGWK